MKIQCIPTNNYQRQTNYQQKINYQKQPNFTSFLELRKEATGFLKILAGKGLLIVDGRHISDVKQNCIGRYIVYHPEGGNPGKIYLKSDVPIEQIKTTLGKAKLFGTETVDGTGIYLYSDDF